MRKVEYMYRKSIVRVVSVILLSLIITTPSMAHSGRTDSNGGHNCNVGACAGTYHYHNGGSTPTSPSVQTPRTPVKTSGVLSENIETKYKSVKKKNASQYIGYKKILTKGQVGLNVVRTTVSYSDGVEVSRAAPVSTVVTAPVDEVVEVGSRTKPVARFTKIRDMQGGFLNMDAGKYIVEGMYKAGQEVTLYQNGKRFGTTKTNKDGYFEFHKLVKADKPSWLVLFDAKGKDGKQLSEKTRATFALKELKTEYSLIHKLK
jgi:hypothetical protein